MIVRRGPQRSWTRMSLAEKQAAHLERMREPAVVCPQCEAQTTVADLLEHVAHRCPGQRPPHPMSRWITWGETLVLGAEPYQVTRWVRRGLVRTREGAPQGAARRYLLRDLVVRLAERRRVRR